MHGIDTNTKEENMRHVSEMRTRDPFFITDKENQRYYLFCNNGAARLDGGPSEGLDIYKTTDFINYDGPYPAIRLPEDAVGKIHHGAPETHCINGKWYAFDQVTGGVLHRDGSYEIDPNAMMGEYVFVADDPKGPYKVNCDGAVTPKEYPCLDGTPYVDEDGQAWLIYAHEWTHIQCGTYEAIRMTSDFSASIGEPITVFSTGEPEWAIGSHDRWPGYEHLFPGEPFWVSDAPFIFRDKAGHLCTLWSTRIENAYVHTFSVSSTGKLEGPWEHEEYPMFTDDGGHAMLFDGLDGVKRIVFHQTDRLSHERITVLPCEITDHGMRLLDKEMPELVVQGCKMGGDDKELADPMGYFGK